MIIDRVIAVVLPTGLLQATVAILNLILFFGLPPPRSDSGTQFVFNFVLSKLFTNSLLSSLNFRGTNGATTVVGANSSSIRSARLPSSGIASTDLEQNLSPMEFETRRTTVYPDEGEERNIVPRQRSSLHKSIDWP
ncbi:hypothetical protein HGRIS_000687 [Hohenbuehelia grisea]|uniref:DUF6534 domain-containing protein n=1 Tax=Hohenbuehelia grisea TaxID=104357 RepID=A0ABR3JTU3_9AGAR